MLVGVGAAVRPVDGSARVEPVELMVDAVRAAASDAGAPSLIGTVDTVAVPEGNWTYPDVARLVADRIGASDARTIRADVGVPQTAPLAVAIDRIRRGEQDVALVVGGEAMASGRAAARDGTPIVETPQVGVVADERWSPSGEIMADAEVQAGMWSPVEQYACIENALGHAEGVTFDEQLDQIAALWAGFSSVASSNPRAAFGEPRSVAELRLAGADNRPLASPYAKWHVSQWNVDQAAALLLCSVGAAEAAGVPRERWVFPHACVESSHTASLSTRVELHRWPAMRVLGDAVAEHIGRPLAEIEVQEVYSCFPVAVRVQQRELGLDLSAIPTVTGGMAFAGGPFNSFTFQATVDVIARLRSEPDALGMVTAVSGLLTKPGITVWGASPPSPVLVGDYCAEAADVTAVLPVTHTATGPATVVTATAAYEGDDPVRSFVIADLADGRRWVGTCHDPAWVEAAARRGTIGTTVQVRGTECSP